MAKAAGQHQQAVALKRRAGSGYSGTGKGNTYLTPQQQTAELTGPVNKAIIDTAQFLKEQGKVPAVATDYSQYVTDRFVQ